MLSNLNYLLVTATCFVGVCTAIRVEWNTNTGPIIPPTPTTTVRPVPPFRDPAPVWQDLSNDIPNPNPYVYVPPPPSRPKQRLNTNVNYNSNDSNRNYGTILTPQNSNTYYQQNNNNSPPHVASFSPVYVPNVGTRYVAVVPTSITTKSTTAAHKNNQAASANALSPDDKTTFYKLQGKYNLKTKKYKVDEKVKYVPLNNYSSIKTSDNATIRQSPLLKDLKLGQTNDTAVNTTATPKRTYSPIKSYTKHIYVKDKTTRKEKFNDFIDKAKKS